MSILVIAEHDSNNLKGATLNTVAAAKELSIKVPLVVRLEGTNVELGKDILNKSGLAIISADNLEDAAQKAVGALS